MRCPKRLVDRHTQNRDEEQMHDVVIGLTHCAHLGNQRAPHQRDHRSDDGDQPAERGHPKEGPDPTSPAKRPADQSGEMTEEGQEDAPMQKMRGESEDASAMEDPARAGRHPERPIDHPNKGHDEEERQCHVGEDTPDDITRKEEVVHWLYQPAVECSVDGERPGVDEVPLRTGIVS